MRPSTTDHVDSIDLVCDEELVPFYEGLGFARLVAMSIRNRAVLGQVG